MTNIFWGLLLCTLRVPLHGFDLLPDWAGALLIWHGAGKLASYSPYFRRARPLALILALAGVPLWLPLTRLHGPAGLCIAAAAGLLMLSVLFLLTRGVRDLEALFSCALRYPALQRAFWVLAAVQLAYYPLRLWLPWLGLLSTLAALLFLYCWAGCCYRAAPFLQS